LKHRAFSSGRLSSKVNESNPHETGRGGLASFFGFAPQEMPEQLFLVDNRTLQARTVGLGYRISPMMSHLDTKNSAGHKNLAPWGSMVRGIPCGQDWIKVGERFLPRMLRDVEVLLLHEDESVHAETSHDGTVSSDSDEQLDMRFLKKLFLGPPGDVQFWDGCTNAERSKRIASMLNRSAQTLLGTSIAGIIVGSGLVPLKMEALSQIGLSCLCAALTLPPAVLGLLPVLIAMGFGPTRTRRRAIVEFAHWIQAGKPKGFNPERQPSPPPTIRMAQLKSVVSHATPDDGAGSANHDWRGHGEIAAEELGFPFTLALRSFTEHIPTSIRTLRHRRKYQDEYEDGDTITVPSQILSPQQRVNPTVGLAALKIVESPTAVDRWDTPPASSESARPLPWP